MPQRLIRFPHPEPDRVKTAVLPVFLPMHGCPGRCLYCDQHAQTGRPREGLESIFANLSRDLDRLKAEGRTGLEIGFYGGTFTALPRGWPERFLALAAEYKASGVLSRVRCSTRPDAVDPGLLGSLAQLGLDMVELGVQTFDEAALAASGRGYARAQALDACAMVKAGGLSLGIQLLPGLPGDRPGVFSNDVEQTATIGPETARLYPCLVVKGTPLAGLYARGGYVPWELDQCVDALATALERLWGAGVRVVRMGLAPETGLDAAVIAGPAHPALGQMARSLALYRLVHARVAALPGKPLGLRLPARATGEFWGHGGALAQAYAGLGLTRDNVAPWDDPGFALVAET